MKEETHHCTRACEGNKASPYFKCSSDSRLQIRKKNGHTQISNLIQGFVPLSGGCTWSESDWSCAYDSVLMSVFYAYLSFDDMQKQRWSQQTAINSALAQSFCCLMS